MAQSDLEQFWRRGHVRELLVSGLPSDDAGLGMWAANGVNCVTGIDPELAHKHGLRTRTWFTMNFMSSQNMDEETIKSMSAVREDGSYLRPYDPLFPTVGKYGWSACVNNPLWVEHTRGVFRGMAESGYDGCHIDYAGHYEPCCCEHCQSGWQAWAGKRGLGATALAQAMGAQELRTQMLLREFRIQCVIKFLAGLRDASREIRPGFAIDGTWHQDSGSTYQWAYGDHFELMCIEGTTYGPFPPASTQIPWLKAAHSLSERPDRAPIAMSVTYHLVADDEGNIHHGRMAADRVRVALAEIISQGGISWLGLGGPQTGNLLREHQDIVRAYYSVARDLEPLLVEAEEVAEIGVVFSPRSYLLSGGARTALYGIVQALMRAHVQFKVLSDVALASDEMEGLSGVVLLHAAALSDAGCKALELYVRAGGRLLVLGSDAATLTEDWRERSPRPIFAIAPEGATGTAEKRLGEGRCWYWTQDVFAGKRLGAAQWVALDQQEPVKLAVEGWSKAEGVSGSPNGDYSLYVDLTHQDGDPLWGEIFSFATGAHDWQFGRKVIESDRPFASANIHMLFRSHRGTAWFRDVKFGVWDEEKQAIVENLLGDTFAPAEGEVYSAGPGEEARKGAWGPYADGFEMEDMLDLGLWVKMSAATGLGVGAMNTPDAEDVAVVLAAMAPLCPENPMVTVECEGADRVFASVMRAGTRIALQLINYNAELHRQLPELEQQAADKSVPARDLVITLAVPGSHIDAHSLETFFPEAKPSVTCETREDGVTVRVDELKQYGVLAFEERAGEDQ